MNTQEGLRLAKQYAQLLKKEGFPLIQVFVYGSVATGKTHPESDIDVAVVCKPFAQSRHEENTALRRARWNIDLRIEPMSLHPEDLENKYHTIGQEVKREGIAVG